MPSKRAPKRKESAARKPRPATPPAEEHTYAVVLRTDGATITATGTDRGLYPKAVAWNRILSFDPGRQSNVEQDKRSLRATGRKTFLDLARSGHIKSKAAEAFILAAAQSGRVQVEMEWEQEDFGYAARVFPWEAIIALATKQQREALGGKDLVVVRWLKRKPLRPAATGPAGFAVSAAAEKMGYNVATERAAIEAALLGKLELRDLPAKTLRQLGGAIDELKPSIIQYVSTEETFPNRPEGVGDSEGKLDEIAAIVARESPQLVAFSTCHSGRRLAPLAIAHGAHLAVGFHGWVADSSCPAFFGTFYRAWQQEGASPLDALRKALAANKTQPYPDNLGAVTLWSASDLMAAPAPTLPAARSTRVRAGGMAGAGKEAVAISVAPPLAEPLHVDCVIEQSLNYSMLHNRSGGIFRRFIATKLAPGRMDDLEVVVRFDNGIERVAECHFFVPLREEANSVVELAERVVVPLGSELLRRRGEMIRGTVEITVKSGARQVFHLFDSIELPPCDEWKDDDAGRRFLPSFIFPRDPAVRDILSAAQPFLRALTDDPIAGFDGYQGSFVGDGVAAVNCQLRAIWTALQTTWRLDYVNPPPAYIGGIQRLRTPEEILRARRGTCIELALLLCACWEHIGIYPVLVLIPGHAFTGYWSSEQAWQDYFEKFVARADSLDPGKEGISDAEDISGGRKIDPSRMSGGGTLAKDQPWVLKGLQHLTLIHQEVAEKRIIPVEATALALQKPFGIAQREGTDLLRQVRRIEDFDAMIDGQKARKEGITPLAILTQSVVA